MDSSADVQIWNNAAFDNGEISEYLTMNNAKASFDSVLGKENQGFAVESKVSSVSSLKSPFIPFKPLNVDKSVENSRNKKLLKKGPDEIAVLKSENVKEIRDEKKINEEIEEIESQIQRLNSRLEYLRLEKADWSVKLVEKIPAKFMEQKHRVKNAEVDDISNSRARTKINRRGISLGPAEIISAGRRGMSMGPSEIFVTAKSRRFGKQEMITPVQSRRKSCFLKLHDIEEERIKSCSLSPKSRKNVKEDMLANLVQPKKLFRDGEKSVLAANKKPSKPGRVVASRYNQNSCQASETRKRSLPENDADNSKRVEKKLSLSVGKTRESGVKKRWEIPSEIVVHGSLEGESYPQHVVVVPELLPRLRISCCDHSPRDSGPAKRVAEMIGRKSFFARDEGVEEEGVCKELNYAEDEDEES